MNANWMSDGRMNNCWWWTLLTLTAWAAATGQSAVVRGFSTEGGLARGEEVEMRRVPFQVIEYPKTLSARHRRREEVPPEDFEEEVGQRRTELLLGDRNRKNVYPRCKQIKGSRRHATVGESRDWPTTPMPPTTVMPQRFPTYVPVVGARALSNLDVFFAHLFENMVALQQGGGPTGPLGHKRTVDGQGTQRTPRGPILVCPEGYVLDDPHTAFFMGPQQGPSSFLPTAGETSSYRKGPPRGSYRPLDLLVEDELKGASRAGVRSKARQEPSLWKWQSISLGKRGWVGHT